MGLHLRQMFRDFKTDPEDVYYAFGNGWNVVTIEKVDYFEFKGENDEVEVAWTVKFRELALPLKLNRTNAFNIAEVLQTEVIEKWYGRTISIMAAKKKYAGKKDYWTYDVDLVAPSSPPTIPANTDVAGAAIDSMNLKLPPGQWMRQKLLGGPTAPTHKPVAIGVETGVAVFDQLQQRGKSLVDAINHLRINAADHYAVGRELPDWDAACLDILRTFIRGCPKVAQPMTEQAKADLVKRWQPPPPPSEVIDKRTGEVLKPSDGSNPAPESIPEDDIPF